MNEERTEDRTKDWRELCKAASKELDPAKLMDLIAELNRARTSAIRDDGKWQDSDSPIRAKVQYLSGVNRNVS